MTRLRSFRLRILAACFLSVAALAVWVGDIKALREQPQEEGSEYEPTEGQKGKDVVWVPTSQSLVEEMLNLAKVRPDDYVFDLGSGDGRTVIAAAKRGARALGVEYNPNMVSLARANAMKAGVADRARFVEGDLFNVDLSPATVITMFLLPEINMRLRPHILDLRPGTRVVSNSFTMGDWEADKTIELGEAENCTYYCTAYLWIVPAKVEGKWSLGPGVLTLSQSYQEISGTLKNGGKTSTIANGRMDGERIGFSVGKTRYQGIVKGDRMNGTFGQGSRRTEWSANRVEGVKRTAALGGERDE